MVDLMYIQDGSSTTQNHGFFTHEVGSGRGIDAIGVESPDVHEPTDKRASDTSELEKDKLVFRTSFES